MSERSFYGFLAALAVIIMAYRPVDCYIRTGQNNNGFSRGTRCNAHGDGLRRGTCKKQQRLDRRKSRRRGIAVRITRGEYETVTRVSSRIPNGSRRNSFSFSETEPWLCRIGNLTQLSQHWHQSPTTKPRNRLAPPLSPTGAIPRSGVDLCSFTLRRRFATSLQPRPCRRACAGFLIFGLAPRLALRELNPYLRTGKGDILPLDEGPHCTRAMPA